MTQPLLISDCLSTFAQCESIYAISGSRINLERSNQVMFGAMGCSQNVEFTGTEIKFLGNLKVNYYLFKYCQISVGHPVYSQTHHKWKPRAENRLVNGKYVKLEIIQQGDPFVHSTNSYASLHLHLVILYIRRRLYVEE